MSQAIDASLPALGSTDGVSPLPVRGRDVEQARLIRRIRRLVRHGDGGVVLIDGPAGVGASRLLEFAVAEAALTGARVLIGSGSSCNALTPLAPLLDALTGDGDPAFVRGLRERGYGQHDVFWLLRETRDRLWSLTVAGRVVVVLDDLHDCDELTLLAIRTLTAQLADRPVLWLVAARSHTDRPAAQSLRLDLLAGHAEHLEPAPLAVPAVHDMVRDLLGTRAAAAEPYLPYLDGLPAVVRHACAQLAEHGKDDRQDGPHAEAAVVGALVSRRLDQLTEEGRELALMAALPGGTLTVRHLARLLGRRESALLRPLREVLAARLLESGAHRLSYSHPAVREAVAATVPQPVRLAVRRRAVDLRLKEGVPTASLAAEVAEVAEPGDLRAVEILRDAAETLAPLAPGPASAHLKRAIALCDDSEADRLRLSARLVPLLWQIGRAGEARALALDILQAPPDPITHAEVCLHLTRMGGALPYAQTHLRLVHRRRDVPVSLKDQLMSVTLLYRLLEGEVEEAGGAVAGTLARTRGTHPVSELTHRTLRSMSACHRQNWGEALRHSETAAEGIAELHPPRAAGLVEVALSTAWRASLLAVASDDAAAMGLVEAGLSEAGQRGRRALVPVWRARRARLLLDAGRLADAAAELTAAQKVSAVPGGSAVSEEDLLCTAVRVASHTGDDNMLEACTATGEEYLTAEGPQRRRVGAWVTLVCAVTREVPSTERQLRGAAALLRRGFLHTACLDPGDIVFLVRAALAVGEGDIASSAVEFAQTRARRCPRFPLFRTAADHARGLLEASAERLVEIADRYAGDRPLLAARALEDAGTAAGAGDPIAARSHYEAALELYTACGADGDCRRVRGRLRTLGTKPAAVGGDGPERRWRGLTPAELGVVRLVARGETNREVAERLFLSPHTVNSHVRHAFEKLGVRSRVQLATLYMREVDGVAEASG
ncbi:LuxR C-terminal-related transcriptional regulator [Streptomyces sp. NPDC057694]|uniref:helix-turn-helix transcriptional regulator n=1 Tax=Streptomyces sp. NPDC057694 TaxID=3346216 RepID=UPI003699F84A